MKTKLSQITEIKSGYLFKEGIRPDKEGSVCVIQLKNVNERGIIDSGDFQRVNLPNSEFLDFVATGDVLFKAKTNRPVAVAVEENWANTIVTAHYFVIRIKDQKVLSKYLAWYLNQRPAQVYFEKYAGGSRVQIINKQTLGDIEIVLPDIETQEKIEKIYSLNQKEHDLAETIYEKKRKLISGQLMDLISREGAHGKR